MNSDILFIIIISFIAGAICQYLVFSVLWPNRHKTYSWIFALRNHKKTGIPCNTDLVLDRDGYSLGYSFKRKSALWASYIISKQSIGVDVERGIRFYADPDVPLAYQVRPEDYTNTGYDKGHLAPSAAIDFSVRSNTQTFAMSNITFQHPKLNRQAWGALEGIIREWTRTKGKLAVVTGPVFTQRPRRINDVPIPKKFYKVVYAFRRHACIGFILPNTEVRAGELWNYVMSVKDVEKETGYKFFTKAGKKAEQAKKKLDLAWWKG